MTSTSSAFAQADPKRQVFTEIKRYACLCIWQLPCLPAKAAMSAEELVTLSSS